MNNINIKASTLASLLEKVVGVVVRANNAMPMLGQILLKHSKDTLSATATDLEVQLSSTVKNVEAGDDFVTTIPGIPAFEIIRSLGEEQIEINVKESSVKIKSPNSSFKLQSLSPKEFPLFGGTEPDITFVATQNNIQNLFNKTAICIGHRDARVYLNGLSLRVSPNTLVSVASDGHRLAKSKVSIDKSNIQETDCLVPRKAVQEIQRIISNEGNVKIAFSDNRAIFEIGTTTLVTKLIDSTFPDYTAMKQFPDSAAVNLILDKEALKTALQRVSIIAKERRHEGRIDIENNTLTISTENVKGEQAAEAISTDGVGNNLSIGFNLSYLLEAVSAGQGELVNLGLNDISKGSLITDPSDPETKYIVMPMKA